MKTFLTAVILIQMAISYLIFQKIEMIVIYHQEQIEKILSIKSFVENHYNAVDYLTNAIKEETARKINEDKHILNQEYIGRKDIINMDKNIDCRKDLFSEDKVKK